MRISRNRNTVGFIALKKASESVFPIDEELIVSMRCVMI